MLYDVKNFEGHDYYLNELKGQIGYKDQDTFSYNCTYGYKTLFAYFYEYERGKISSKNIEFVGGSR